MHSLRLELIMVGEIVVLADVGGNGGGLFLRMLAQLLGVVQ